MTFMTAAPQSPQNTVVLIHNQNRCPPHQWLYTSEPTCLAWVVCLLTGFCCSLCICTRKRCVKCGLEVDA
jgi:hypothetical protein